VSWPRTDVYAAELVLTTVVPQRQARRRGLRRRCPARPRRQRRREASARRHRVQVGRRTPIPGPAQGTTTRRRGQVSWLLIYTDAPGYVLTTSLQLRARRRGQRNQGMRSSTCFRPRCTGTLPPGRRMRWSAESARGRVRTRVHTLIRILLDCSMLMRSPYQSLSHPCQAARPHFLGSSPGETTLIHPPPGRSARRKSATWPQRW